MPRPPPRHAATLALLAPPLLLLAARSLPDAFVGARCRPAPLSSGGRDPAVARRSIAWELWDQHAMEYMGVNNREQLREYWQEQEVDFPALYQYHMLPERLVIRIFPPGPKMDLLPGPGPPLDLLPAPLQQHLLGAGAGAGAAGEAGRAGAIVRSSRAIMGAAGSLLPALASDELAARELAGSLGLVAVASAQRAISPLTAKHHKGVVHRPMHRLIPLVANNLLTRAPELDGREASEALWSSAVLMEDAPLLASLLPPLTMRVATTAKEMNAQESVKALCALIFLRAEARATRMQIYPLLLLLMNRVLSDDTYIENWALANLFWAVSLMKLKPEPMAKVIAWLVRQTRPRLASLNGRESALILWSLATFCRAEQDEGLQGEDRIQTLLPGLLRRLRSKAARVAPRDLAASLWSMGILARFLPDMTKYLDSLENELALAMDTASMQELSLALWGLVRLDYKNKDILDIAANQVLRQRATTGKRLLADALPRIIWAFAKLGRRDADMMEVMAVNFSGGDGVGMKKLTGEQAQAVLWSLRNLEDNVDDIDHFEHFRQLLYHKVKMEMPSALKKKVIPRPYMPDSVYFIKNKEVKTEVSIRIGTFGPDATIVTGKRWKDPYKGVKYVIRKPLPSVIPEEWKEEVAEAR